MIPSQTQLLLPLLESLNESGGSARPQAVYDSIAEKLQVPGSVRDAKADRAGASPTRLFDRQVRWTRQTAVMKGLVAKGARGVWALTVRGSDRLKNIRRGVVVTIMTTPNGIYLCGNAEDVVAYIEPGSVDLLLTSPPYPLLHPRAYGNPNHIAWVDWMLRLCEKWLPLLHSEGSMMFNLGPCWRPGEASQSTYAERFLIKIEDDLGIHLLQRLDWHSPSKPTGPMPWVSRQRKRITSSVEPILWVSPNPNAYGNNRNVLRQYSPGGLRAIREAHKDHRMLARPSGWKFGRNSHTQGDGSVPTTLLTVAPNSSIEQELRRAEKAAGTAKHPAIMPAAVANFCIRLATEPGFTVYDPFGGSGTTAVEAEKLQRFAIHSDRAMEYFASASLRAELAGIPVCVGDGR